MFSKLVPIGLCMLCARNLASTECALAKEQTEPKISAEIRPKAKIRLRLGRNRTPIYKFRFRLGRNRNLMTNVGLNRKFGRNCERKDIRGRHGKNADMWTLLV